MSMRVPASEAGFTLIELLVSLTLTALAASVLVAALWAGRSAWQRSETLTAGSESVAAAQNLLRDRIEHLFADQGDTPGQSVGMTQGDAQSFTFFASPINSRAPGPLLRYVLGRSRSGDLDLDAMDARSTRSRWTVLPVIGNVRAIQLAYYGAASGDDLPSWQASWQDQVNPPMLVRLRLRFAPGDQRQWPDLVVAPAVNVSAGCRVDPSQGTCV